MKVVLKVSSNNEHCDGGCELELVDLSPELAALALRRMVVLREQKCLDPDVDETYYWAHVVEYFSPWVSLASTEEEVEPAVKVANVLVRWETPRLCRGGSKSLTARAVCFSIQVPRPLALRLWSS